MVALNSAEQVWLVSRPASSSIPTTSAPGRLKCASRDLSSGPDPEVTLLRPQKRVVARRAVAGRRDGLLV